MADSLEDALEDNSRSYPINTGDIFHNEDWFWRQPKESTLTSYPSRIADDLLYIIQHLLVKYSTPSISHSDDKDKNDYLHERHRALYNSPLLENPNPFAADYFVLGLNKPRETYDGPQFSFGGDYYYLYKLRQSLHVRRFQLQDGELELLLAFSIRQCNISELDYFLQYHLEESFAGDMKSCIKYLNLIKRKYETMLFNKGQIEALNEWISLNEKIATTKKIKSFLTVDQLAYLFKALMDAKLIDNGNKSTIINAATDCFESKQKTDLSPQSFNGKFFTPTPGALEFWADQFDKLSKQAIRELQKKDT